MKTFLFILIFEFVSIIGFSQSGLNASLIPDSLKNNADAVCRFSTTEYTRISKEKVHIKVHSAVTILNKDGARNGNLAVYYDDLRDVKYIKGNVYNSAGAIIKKLKKADIKDVSSYANYTLFSDNRVKYINVTSNNYPYTVEYEYEVTQDGIVGFAPWMPVESYNFSVQKAKLVYITPKDISFKYKNLNGSFDFQKSKIKDKDKYSWTVENLPAEEYEPYSTSYYDYSAIVLLTPNEFVYDGTEGNLKSWETYGNWAYSLIKDRDILDDNTIEKIKTLVDTVADKKKQAQLIYEYMQAKTRYVNIALGIGGFQPMKAMDVDKLGYGDCKALSNYTKSLLKIANISSYYTEIGNGNSRKINYPNFSSANQTNHVILCVPFETDTVWLECTSQNIPFGFIGQGNSDRYALLITKDGGKLARTPKYTKEDNQIISNAIVFLDNDGSLQSDINIEYCGLQYSEGFRLSALSRKEQKEKLLKSLPIAGLRINNFNLNFKEYPDPTAYFSISASSYKYVSNIGKRMFVELNLLSKFDNEFDSKKKRLTDIYFPVGYMETDTIIYNIPSGYKVDFLPKNTEISSPIGKYKITTTTGDGTVTYSRQLIIAGGTYDKKHFSEIMLFAKKVEKYDNLKMVLISEE